MLLDNASIICNSLGEKLWQFAMSLKYMSTNLLKEKKISIETKVTGIMFGYDNTLN